MNGRGVHMQDTVSGKCDLFSLNCVSSSTQKLHTDLQASLGSLELKKERRNNQLKNYVKPRGRLSHDCSETCRVTYV